MRTIAAKAKFIDPAVVEGGGQTDGGVLVAHVQTGAAQVIGQEIAVIEIGIAGLVEGVAHREQVCFRKVVVHTSGKRIRLQP